MFSKIRRTITIYFMKTGGAYFIPYGITTQGVSYACEPFEFVANGDDMATVWSSTLITLRNANRLIAHPDKWGETTAWFKHAGVRTWQQFGTSSRAVTVSELDNEYEIAPLAWDGRGFAGQKEKRRRFSKVADLAEVYSILAAAKSQAT